MSRLLLALAALVLLPLRAPAAAATQATPAERTRVVILGVDHSAQLVSRRYRPAVVEAFMDRVKPDAVCVERDPDQFAQGDLYEFTYEAAEIALPYVRSHGLGVCPIDWIPPKQDQVLAFGLDLDAPPPVRPAEGFQGFLTFGEEALGRGLFWAEDRTALKDWDAFADTPAKQPTPELSRRLFLYRTALQARRIEEAARAWSGRTLLVVVGAYHERDIKRFLAADPRIELVEATSFGAPSAEEAAQLDRPRYLLAALNFNLLGRQAATGRVDWSWMGEMLDSLDRAAPTPETRLLRIRLGRLTGRLTPAEALKAYRALLADTPAEAAFTWTGVKDRSRLDSFFDPFGNMSVSQRIVLETGRELYALSKPRDAETVRDELAKGLSPTKAGELSAYWDMFMRPKGRPKAG
jgi:hypothetical protein